jgi:hypothetical protein
VDDSPRLPTLVLASDRARRVAVAVLLAMAAAVLLSTMSGSGSGTVGGRLGGDYPAFYAAGRMVVDGQGHQLYDADRQATAQSELFGDEHDGYLSFAYPPQVAAAYAPLALLPYRLSYLVSTALSVVAVAVALRLVRPMVPLLQVAYLPCLALALGFYPLWRGVTGGQNTAVTLLLIAWFWRSIVDRHDAMAGAAIGILLGKPQLAIALVIVAAVLRRGRVLAMMAATGTASWAIAAIVAGAGWVGPWLRFAREFGDRDALVNRANAVSLMGAADALFGVGSNLGRLIAVPLVLAMLVALVVAACRARANLNHLTALFALAPAAMVLLPPHAMFYDAGLVILPLLVITSCHDLQTPRLAGMLWLGGFGQLLADNLGVSPLAALVPAVAIVVLWRRPQSGPGASNYDDLSTPALVGTHP